MKVPKNRPYEVRYDGCWRGYYSTRERAEAAIDRMASVNYQPGYNYLKHRFSIIDHTNGR